MTEQQMMDNIKLLPDHLKKEAVDLVGYLLEKSFAKQQSKLTPNLAVRQESMTWRKILMLL